ncbi:transmembrane protein 6/97 [Globomyces pollinis-pini]|nr:transmembrane protein 6/97 [Globomyces pollinis-pini]
MVEGKSPIWKRPMDLMVFSFFLCHIPITILFAPQVVLPPDMRDVWIPESFKLILLNSVELTGDPILAMAIHGRPTWIAWVMAGELLFQLPFFFYACYCLMKNVDMRMACVVYTTHVLTTMMPVVGQLMSSSGEWKQVIGWQLMYM